MYSFLNFEPVCCSMSSFNCCFLTCMQVSQETGQVVWYSHLFQNFPQFVVIHTVKGLSRSRCCSVIPLLSLWSSKCWQFDLWFLFSKSSLYIWKFLVHVLLKSKLKDFEHYVAYMWKKCSCTVVWTSFGIAFLWEWNENWPFPVLWPLVSFPNLLAHRV